MDVEGLQRTWDELGRSDPLWAVLSLPEKRGGRWDLEEFLATGVREVDEALAAAESIPVSLRFGAALDFGCGVGRLTQPLAARFERVTGVDIAPSMIELAERLNRHGDRCRYILNDRGDLSQFDDGTFDFIYSSITLQHMPRRFMRSYVTEFVRILAPGGVLVFQLPARPPGDVRSSLKRLIPRFVRSSWRRLRHGLGGEPPIQMFWTRPARVTSIVRRAGGEVVAAVDDFSGGSGWVGKRYMVRRTGA